MTPEHSFEKEETSCGRCPYDKGVETPQMRAVRAKALQRLDAKNKSSLSETSYAKTLGNKRMISSAKSSTSKLRNDKAVTFRDKNFNETFTPQMRVLYEKIEQRNSNASSSSKTPKVNAMNKQKGSNIANQKSTKTQEKQEKNTDHRKSITRNKHDIEQHNKNQNVSSKGNLVYI